MSYRTLYAMTIVMVLFFLTGFTTVFNSILSPYFQKKMNLNYTSVVMIQSSFYFAYLVCSPLAGNLCKQNCAYGIRSGLFIGAVGMFIMVLGAYIDSFSLILTSIFIQGSAIAITQVTSNPYIFGLGSPESASSRFLFAQGFISVGMVTAPYLGSNLILSPLETESITFHSPLIAPYLLLSLIWLCLFLLTVLFAIPKGQIETQSPTIDTSSPLQDRQVLSGMLSVGLCVGVETAISSFIVRFLADPTITGFPLSIAGRMSFLFWLGFMIGRFIGSWLLRFVTQEKLLIAQGIFGTFFVFLALSNEGSIAAAAIIILGLCASNLFPLVFSMTLSKTPCCKTKVSSYLCMANIGGAIVPFIQGKVADLIGLKGSFLVPMFCFIYFILFGIAQLWVMSHELRSD